MYNSTIYFMLKRNIYLGWQSINITTNKIIILIFFAHLALRKVRVHILYEVMHMSDYIRRIYYINKDFLLNPKHVEKKKITRKTWRWFQKSANLYKEPVLNFEIPIFFNIGFQIRLVFWAHLPISFKFMNIVSSLQ